LQENNAKSQMSGNPYLFDVSKKRILITESCKGLGYQIERGFLDHGATVILNGRSTEKLHQAAFALRNFSFKIEECCFDVTSETEVRKAIGEIDEKGGIDVLINNAGIQRRTLLDKVELSVWQEVLATNLTGAMLVSSDVVRGMIPRQAGKIINICSLMR